jgi:methyl-accepting chemotaxis protein
MATAYQGLSAVYGARQAHAFVIESRVSSMRSAADRFLLTRDLAYAEQTLDEAAKLRAETAELAKMDTASAQTAAAIRALADDFASRFEAIVTAWRTRGLDEDSGLQGAFREAVHELQARAAHYNVDQLYLLLLQVRRGEKDLGLRREPRYRDQVYALLDEMQATLGASELRADTKAALRDGIAAYGERFGRYAEAVLAGEPIDGGKGPFRDRAHRIEDLLQAHYVPDLETAILQMRRREKDYLLRGDAQYIAMVDGIAADIAARIADSAVAGDQKSELLALLDNYRRDFNALVTQNERIGELTEEMFQAAARITPLVEANLAEATATMAQQSAAIADDSARRARWSLLVAAVTPVLGLLLALVITALIVRPVRRMVGLLDQLTREVPRERLDADPAGRDEINDMAIALNTLADHRARFSDWWRSSMQAATACRDLSETDSDDERIQAALEMRKAFGGKLAQLQGECGRMLEEAARLDAIAERERGNARGRANAHELRSIAGRLRTLARMLEAG